jgi:hypothetical protein
MSIVVQMSPVVGLPIPRIENLNLEWLSDTTVKLTAGKCWDASETFGMVIDEDITINGAVNGVNSLDVGDLEAAKTYAVFVIGSQANKKAPSAIISLDYETPYLPADFDLCKRVGFLRTDGSAHFWPFYQSGNGARRHYRYNETLNLLTGGTSITNADVDVSPAIPAIDNIEIGLKLSYTPNTASNAAAIFPFGATVSNVAITGVVAGETQVAQVCTLARLDDEIPKIQYKVSSASDSLDIDADYYIDNL